MGEQPEQDDPAVQAMEAVQRVWDEINDPEMTDDVADALIDTKLTPMMLAAIKTPATTLLGVLAKIEFFYEQAHGNAVGGPDDIEPDSIMPINWIGSVERDLLRMRAEGLPCETRHGLANIIDFSRLG